MKNILAMFLKTGNIYLAQKFIYSAFKNIPFILYTYAVFSPLNFMAFKALFFQVLLFFP